MHRLLTASGLVLLSLALTSFTTDLQLDPLFDDPGTSVVFSSISDERALQEMLRGARGVRQRWNRVPELAVLDTVMEYREGTSVEYRATGERLSQQEIGELVKDLTSGLRVLTANTIEGFARVDQIAVEPGGTATVSHPNQIVAGRFKGVQKSLKTIGMGGRQARPDGTITAGAVILDSDFDRSSSKRRLLRTHELGHALGYNHVSSRASIMNPKIGSEPSDFDRQAALLAFRSPAFSSSH